ncbi:hypothetical protein AGOR_G00136780 [Albula goreensis]|uniref:WH1 domain-containing protein n=1 Tax=Albula goreensis TaxID=1534307 RepID=A0A8T3D558_9TELE|nr:hypothetical protein AGOR_G00136780 [Albula goreensis]
MTHPSQSGSSGGLRVYSNLISSRENALLFNLLGPKCSAVETAVAQLYVAPIDPGDQEATWRCKDSGVVCLVKDCSLSSYFLRLYSVKRAKLLWEQELYMPFRYSAPRPYFHTFPADDCQAGLNFADEEEAERFHLAVKKQIERAQGAKNNSPGFRSQVTRAHTLGSSSCQFFRSKLNKPDIPLASNLSFESNASGDTEKGFDVNNLDPDLQKLFVKAGISKTDLEDRHICRIIYSIMERQGGLEAVETEVQSHHPQTLSKCRGDLTSLAQRKGPLPPLPTQSGVHSGKETPFELTQCNSTRNISQGAHRGSFHSMSFTNDTIPPPPSMTAPRLSPGHPLKSHHLSFHSNKGALRKDRGCLSTAEHHDIIGEVRGAIKKKYNTLQPPGDKSNKFDESSSGGEWPQKS